MTRALPVWRSLPCRPQPLDDRFRNYLHLLFFRPLPRIAQAAPGFGVIVTDFDGDGHADIYMAQNFYTPQPETGRMAGGLSLLLLGKGDGTFAPVSPGQSGIVVPGDARSATIAYLDADPWPDLVVGLNDAAPVAFQNRGGTNRVLDVRLRGKPGNPQAVGARVTVHMDDGAIFHPVPEDIDFSAPVSLARLEYRSDGRVLYRGNYHRRRY